MNFLKPKASSSPQPPQGPPPPVLFLHQVFSSLQTNLSNFLHHSPLSRVSVPAPRSPLLARISDAINAVSPDSALPPFSYSSSSNRALSTETIEERLAGVPVYALSNGSEEFVTVSGHRTGKTLGFFCFSEADASALLQQMKSMDPSMENGARIVPVALNKLFQLKVDGVSFRLIPEPSQVKNAMEAMTRTGDSDDRFPGVPVFQSRRLVMMSENKRYRPVFFRKEDLEKSLSRVSSRQSSLNPILRARDIQVGSLEDIIEGMKDSSSSQYNDVVFIPPGLHFDAAQIEKRFTRERKDD